MKKAAAIKDVVGDVIKNLSAGRASQAETLKDSWARAIGAENLKHAKPVDFRENILIIHVDSSSWLHKLAMDKPRILMRIKDELGRDALIDIKLRIGEL